jgi:hypothetical protein
MYQRPKVQKENKMEEMKRFVISSMQTETVYTKKLDES